MLENIFLAGRRRDASVEFEEPLLYRRSSDPARHYVVVEEQREFTCSIRSRPMDTASGQRSPSSFRSGFSSTWGGRIFSIPFAANCQCAAISVVIWWLFARVMTAKTVKGARTQVAVLGFQEFMNRVDADRLKLMPPTTFEKYLPSQWRWASSITGRRLCRHHQRSAKLVRRSWRRLWGWLQSVFFSSSMHSMATDMHQVFVSAPRASSSGSGFSGGGGGRRVLGWRLRWRRRERFLKHSAQLLL